MPTCVPRATLPAVPTLCCPAGDARRWNGVRTVVQARALLKTVFRSASQHKAQASGRAAHAGRRAPRWAGPYVPVTRLPPWNDYLPTLLHMLACHIWAPFPTHTATTTLPRHPHVPPHPDLPPSQAVEAQAQVTELSDEIELLKLRLDIAEQEKYEAAQRAAEAAALLHQHQQAAERSAGGGGGGGGGHHAASTMLPAAQGVAADVSADVRRSGAGVAGACRPLLPELDSPPPQATSRPLASCACGMTCLLCVLWSAWVQEGLLEAQEILQQLNVLAIEDPLTGGGAAAGEADRHATSGGSSDEASDSQVGASS